MSNGGPPPDHVIEDSAPDEEPEDVRLEVNLKSKATWLRSLFMIVFLAFYVVSRIVVVTVVVAQFLWVLFTGKTNERLSSFGLGLATYSYQILTYLMFNTERQPFPFTDWPMGPPGVSEE